MARRIIQPIIEETESIEKIEQQKIIPEKPKVQTIAPKTIPNGGIRIEKQVESADTEEDPKEKEKLEKQKNVDLWGKGFNTDEYRELNKKLTEFVKYYPLRTAMHQEALVTYLKYAKMRDKAIENDEVEEADKWGKLAAKQAQDAKINPSQLSIADLSNGISNVGKIVEAVEKVEDVIPILPQFVRQPRDEVDYTIWLYVQYCQRLTNMPESSYADIYKFVMEKYNHNKKDYEFLVKEENKNYKEPM